MNNLAKRDKKSRFLKQEDEDRLRYEFNSHFIFS